VSIQTAQSLHGVITAPPQAIPDGETMRAQLTIGQPRKRRLPDGTVVCREMETCQVVLSGTPAQRALGRFRIGDAVIAAGRLEPDGVFHADRIGPDTATTSFELMPGRARQPRAAERTADDRTPASMPAPARFSHAAGPGL